MQHYPVILLSSVTPGELLGLSAAFWEDYALPFIQAQNGLLELLETVELPVSRTGLADIKAARAEWLETWSRFTNEGVRDWIAAADTVDLDSLTDDELGQVRGAINVFTAYRDQALENNADVEMALLVWIERAAATAPDGTLAQAILELAKGIGEAAKKAGEAADLWPLVPIGLGALGLFWFFGRPKRR